MVKKNKIILCKENYEITMNMKSQTHIGILFVIVIHRNYIISSKYSVLVFMNIHVHMKRSQRTQQE